MIASRIRPPAYAGGLGAGALARLRVLAPELAKAFGHQAPDLLDQAARAAVGDTPVDVGTVLVRVRSNRRRRAGRVRCRRRSGPTGRGRPRCCCPTS